MNTPLLTITISGQSGTGRSLLLNEIKKLLKDKGLKVWIAADEHEIQIESPAYLETVLN